MELLQGDSDDAEYRPLGHAEEDAGDDLEEFNVSQDPRPLPWSSQWFWWPGLFCLAIVCLAIAAVLIHWVGPIFLDKVTFQARCSTWK